MPKPPFGGRPPWGGQWPPQLYDPPPKLLTAGTPLALPYVSGYNYAITSNASAIAMARANPGDGLVIFIYGTINANAVSDNYNSTYQLLIRNSSDGSANYSVAVCPYVRGTNPVVTIAGSGANVVGVLLTIVGGNPGWFVDGLRGNVATNTTPFIKTTTPNTLLLGAFGSGLAPTPPAGWFSLPKYPLPAGDTGYFIGWAPAPSPVGTISPAWATSNGGGIFIGIRSALSFPSHAIPDEVIPQYPPGVRIPYIIPWGYGTPPQPSSVAITPNAGAITLASDPLTMGLGIAPGVGTITLLGAAPAVVQSTVLTPTAGTITLSGVAPSLILGTVIAPPAGAITLSGVAPTLIAGTVFAPPAGTITLTGVAPTVVRGTVITPTVGTITLTGIAPALVLGTVIQPGAGSIVFNGNAPVLTQSGPIIVPTGTITLNGLAPSMNLGITPGVGTITLTGLAPTLNLGIAPGAGAIVFNGVAPAVVQGTPITPGVGAITLSGNAPGVVQGTVRTPTVGAVGFNGVFSAPNPVVLGIDGSTWGFTSLGGQQQTNGNAISSGGLAGFPAQIGLATQAWIRIGGASTAANVKICVYDAGGNLVAVSNPIAVATGVKSASINVMLTNQSYTLVAVPDSGFVGVAVLTGSSAFVDKQWTAAHFPYATPPTVLPAADASSGQQFAVWLTGGEPTLDLGIKPPVGAITLTGAAPVLTSSAGSFITPSVGAVTLQGAVPIVGSQLTVPAGAVSFSGVAGQLNLGLTPGTGSITITGQQPQFGKIIIAPGVGAITLLGYTPSQGTVIQPRVGSLILAGQKAGVGILYAIPPPYLIPQRASTIPPSVTGSYMSPQRASESVNVIGDYLLPEEET